jgi:cytochrome b561
MTNSALVDRAAQHHPVRVLRISHSTLAFLLFLTFTAHMTAVLFHTLVLRDRLIDRMALWPTKSAAPAVRKT